MTQTNAHSKTLLRIMNDHDAQLGDHPSIEVDKSIVETWAGVKIIEPFKEYFSPHYARKLLSTQNNNNTFQFNQALAGSLPEMSWDLMHSKSRQEIEIRYAWTDTPFGEGLICETDRGVCGLAFCHTVGRERALADMKSRWSLKTCRETKTPAWDICSLMSGAAPLHLMGTALQLDVWRALLYIPSGCITDYATLAQHAGRSAAVRAVASSIGKNPISWLIPCHRVIRKTGDLGGYHWGTSVKRLLLAYEGLRKDFADDGAISPIT